MARNFDSSANEYLEASAPPVTSVPLTMACFMRRATSSGSRTLITLDKVSGVDRIRLGVASSNKLFAQTTDGVSSKTAIHLSSTTFGQWHHACAVFPSTSLRRIYMDGGAPTTNSSTSFPSGINGAHIGALREGPLGITRFFSGDIAMAAVWNVALTGEEVGRLAEGIDPLCLLNRIGNLVMFQDLIRPLNRPGMGPSVTASGTTVANHPRSTLLAGPPAIGARSTPAIHLRNASAEAFVSGARFGQLSNSGAIRGLPTFPGTIAAEAIC